MLIPPDYTLKGMLKKIEHKVLVGFAGTFIILLITGWFLFRQNQRANEAGQWLGHTTVVLHAVSEIQTRIASLNIELRDSVPKSKIGDLQHKAATITRLGEALKQLTRDNAGQQQNIGALLALLHKKERLISGLSLTHRLAPANSKRLDKEIVLQLTDILSEEHLLLSERQSMFRHLSERANLFFTGLCILMVSILVLVYVMLARNLSAQRKVEAKLKRLNRQHETSMFQLQQLNAELESFSYTVSHDLRAPLRAIHGYTRILAEDYASQLDTEAQRVMKVISDNATQMGQLIDDLLAFSRLGRKELSKDLVDMQSLVEEVITELPAQKHVKWTVENILPVRGDVSMLRQVWVNLLSNALKYSAGKDTQLIRVSGSQENGQRIYCVEDNGVGFDMAYYDKLFGVFQRLHDTYEFEGTGVGLAIAHRIINKHKGRIWATAELNKGARFCFSIPEE